MGCSLIGPALCEGGEEEKRKRVRQTQKGGKEQEEE